MKLTARDHQMSCDGCGILMADDGTAYSHNGRELFYEWRAKLKQ